MHQIIPTFHHIEGFTLISWPMYGTYLCNYIPNLTTHASVLHVCLLPNTAAEKAYFKHLKENKRCLLESWQGWGWNFGPAEQVAFDALQCTVSTVPCLTTISYDAVKAGTLKVFLVMECFQGWHESMDTC